MLLSVCLAGWLQGVAGCGVWLARRGESDAADTVDRSAELARWVDRQCGGATSYSREVGEGLGSVNVVRRAGDVNSTRLWELTLAPEVYPVV